MENCYLIIFKPEFEFHEFRSLYILLRYLDREQDRLEKCSFKIIKGEEI